MQEKGRMKHRIERHSAPSVQNWKPAEQAMGQEFPENVIIQCGWGRLIMGHTFRDAESLAAAICAETAGERDIAFYLRDPHVVLSMAPDRIFLDPSHSYRLWLHQYRPSKRKPVGFHTRRVRSGEDAAAINEIFAKRHMVTADEQFILDRRKAQDVTYFVAEAEEGGPILGSLLAVDHVAAFGDPENGSSFWSLAVDPQCDLPGVGEALVRYVVEHFLAKGRQFVDLSVMHDNHEAIRLYNKLGFQRVPVFAVKRKNPINERLFTAAPPEEHLNPYAALIVDEARRRGIAVEMVDVEAGHFALTHGGRRIVCWESLTELTSAIAFARCDDKTLTRRTLAKAGIRVPAQQLAGNDEDNLAFLEEHERLVVKPRQGEQGAGVVVDVRSKEDLDAAVYLARDVCDHVLLEEFVEGQDLRIIVIDHHVVAAAVRRPPMVTGTGQHTVSQLIEKLSRRRQAATGGESSIPLDGETERCVALGGHEMGDVLEEGETLLVRKAANLHTGGTIHDVTAELSPALSRAAEEASRVLDIPVVGFDFMVPDVAGDRYAVIEANERPGLANHEPQPTAERFVDLLFPQTAGQRKGS